MLNYFFLTIIWILLAICYFIIGNISIASFSLATMLVMVGGIIIERTGKGE